jgi:hypothetical protein
LGIFGIFEEGAERVPSLTEERRRDSSGIGNLVERGFAGAAERLHGDGLLPDRDSLLLDDV